ncbi:hypothetical protein PsYK624_154430 [Phanerochaete sordida]|uniref:Uncharacterized protein n=1 Tax=Phanerochaete sordida TaxID=48140 RepID=A0A9P3GRU1_9APHY|nr:hypothetical protein PsYK624_154430 [Phanerochaete sordida]
MAVARAGIISTLEIGFAARSLRCDACGPTMRRNGGGRRRSVMGARSPAGCVSGLPRAFICGPLPPGERPPARDHPDNMACQLAPYRGRCVTFVRICRHLPAGGRHRLAAAADAGLRALPPYSLVPPHRGRDTHATAPIARPATDAST